MNRLTFVVAALAAATSSAAAQPAPAQPAPAAPAQPAPAQPAPVKPAPAREPTGRTIDLSEAISLATRGNIEIAVGKERIVTAEAEVRATKTHRLPILTVKAGIQYWNDEIAAAFPQDVDMNPATPDVPIPIVIRPQVTANAEAMIVQPITAAIVLGKLIDLSERLVDVERAEVEIKKLDVAYQVAQGYLAVLQVETLHEIAETSVRQLQANLERAQALRQAEVLGDVDVLRIQAQLDSVKQQALEAELEAETLRTGLVTLINLPDGTRLQLQPVDTTPPTIEWSEEDAVRQARRQRPEVRRAAAAARAADLSIKVAQAQYLPNLVAVADYQHTFNAGDFGATADAAFIGLNLEWNLWDWGERKAQVDKARSASRTAKLAVEATDDLLAFDVRSKFNAATAKRETLVVAESGLRAAEEAYRLQQVRFTEGVATTTDVLDAESEVGRARSQATIARYQYLIAWMALVRAVGQVPEAPAAAPSSPATAPSAP